MLSFLPKFEVGDFVFGPFPYAVRIFRIRTVYTKFLFFHSYQIEEVDYDPERSEVHSTYRQNQLVKLDYYDIVIFFSTLVFRQFGEANRTGKHWTDIENSILKDAYPMLSEFDKPELFQIDLQTIFGRSIRAIETQYKKVTNHE